MFGSTGFTRECLFTASSISCLKAALDFSLRAKPTQAKWEGNKPSRARLYKAGNNRRAVRSPEAPNITNTHGSAVLYCRVELDNGLTNGTAVGGSIQGT